MAPLHRPQMAYCKLAAYEACVGLCRVLKLIEYLGAAKSLTFILEPKFSIIHHHHHVACPEADVAVPTSLLHACRFCAR